MSCRRSGVGERTGRMEADGSGGLSSYQLAALRANMAAAPPPAASGHFHNRAHAPSGFPWQRRLLSNGREVAGPGLGARPFAPDRRPWDSSREGRRRRRRAVEAKGRGAEPPGVRVRVLAGSPARVRESREPRLGGGGGGIGESGFSLSLAASFSFLSHMVRSDYRHPSLCFRTKRWVCSGHKNAVRKAGRVIAERCWLRGAPVGRGVSSGLRSPPALRGWSRNVSGIRREFLPVCLEYTEQALKSLR